MSGRVDGERLHARLAALSAVSEECAARTRELRELVDGMGRNGRPEKEAGREGGTDS
jgi:hypothetical protein